MAGTLLSSLIATTLQWSWKDTALPVVTTVNQASYTEQFAGATGADNANKLYVKTFTIAGAGTQIITLSALTDPEGVALAFTKVRGIYIENNKLTTSTNITVAPSAVHPFTGPWVTSTGNGVQIPNKSATAFCNPSAAGWAVGAGATDQFTITNNDGANSATVIVAINGE